MFWLRGGPETCWIMLTGISPSCLSAVGRMIFSSALANLKDFRLEGLKKVIVT